MPLLSRRLAALAAICSLVVAGCSIGDDDEVTVTPVADAHQGGTLRIAIGQPGSIDPNNAYEPNGELVASTLCDTLLQQDPATGVLRGNLAESFQMTDGGSKMIVRLRKDLRFSNGRTLTADDVSATLSRLASSDYASFRQDLLSLVGGFPEVSGEVDTKVESLRQRLWGVRIIDSRSFEIRLRSAGAGGAIQFRMADYLGVLATTATAPVPRLTIQDDPTSFDRAPVCVGPYRVAKPWDGKATEIRLVRNTHYADHNPAYSAGGRGYADEIVFRIYPTPAARAAALAAGQVDLAPLGADQAERLRQTDSGTDEVQVGTTPAVQYVGVATSGPFGEPAARAALSLALDREAIARTVYAGLASPASGFLSPALGEGLFQPRACDLRSRRGPVVRWLTYPLEGLDTVPARAAPAAARALLARSGTSARTTPLKLRFNDEGRNAALAQAVAQAWRSTLGLTVTLVPMPWKSYLAMATSPSGFDGAFLESWAPDYPGPDQYVGPLFTSDGVGESNWSHFTNPAFDTELTRYIRGQEDAADLSVSYQGAERFLCAHLPLVPLVFGRAATGVDTTRIGTASGEYLHHSTAAVLVRELYRKDLP